MAAAGLLSDDRFKELLAKLGRIMDPEELLRFLDRMSFGIEELAKTNPALARAVGKREFGSKRKQGHLGPNKETQTDPRRGVRRD